MGCENYDGIYFSDSGDICCLCTFPHNDEADEFKLDEYRVKALAYLGAAIVLKKRGLLVCYKNSVISIPDDLPKWIVSEIDRNVKSTGEK